MSDEMLAGRAAVVVGGSRGVGREVAGLLSTLGASVVVNGRDPDAVDAAAAEITGSGGAAIGFAGSPADEQTAADLIAACTGEFGRLDILINCAGVPEPPGSSILTVSSEDFRDLLDAHLMTVFATCRAGGCSTTPPRRAHWTHRRRSTWLRCTPTSSATWPPG